MIFCATHHAAREKAISPFNAPGVKGIPTIHGHNTEGTKSHGVHGERQKMKSKENHGFVTASMLIVLQNFSRFFLCFKLFLRGHRDSLHPSVWIAFPREAARVTNVTAKRTLLLLMTMLLTISTTATAEEEIHKFDNPEQRALYMQLADELRCPKCQNQNIADSNASVAKDLRNKVHKLVMQGQDKQQIINFMVERYGHFVYYKPPVTAATLILWLLPIAFVLFTMVLIWLKSKKSQLGIDKSQWTDEQERELNKLISDIEQPQSSSPIDKPLSEPAGSS